MVITKFYILLSCLFSVASIHCSGLIALSILNGICAAQEPLAQIDTADIETQENAYREFAELTRKSRAREPMPEAAKMFLKISSVKSPHLAYRVTLVFRQYSIDQNVIVSAKNILTGAGEPSISSLLAALIYLEKYDNTSFLAYFNKRGYLAIPAEIRLFMATSRPVLAAKRQYISSLVSVYLAAKTPDDNIRTRKELLSVGSDVAQWAVENFEDRENQRLDAGLIWLLGEISAPECGLLLFNDYIGYSNFRTAISIGSCLSAETVSRIFGMKYWSSEASLRELLRDIYGEKWQKVKHLSLDQLHDDLLKSMQTIRSDCQKRSIQQLE